MIMEPLIFYRHFHFLGMHFHVYDDGVSVDILFLRIWLDFE